MYFEFITSFKSLFHSNTTVVRKIIQDYDIKLNLMYVDMSITTNDLDNPVSPIINS